MSEESQPIEPVAADPVAPAGRTSSEAQIAATRENAKKLNGPRSVPGKKTSRCNALKHGHRAVVVDVPGEDPALFKTRFDVWRKDHNPQGDEIGDYLLTITVRKSLGLDRLHVAQASRAAERAGNAVADRAESCAREVEGLLRLIDDDPGTAVRRLKQTTAGCLALIDDWDHRKAPLHAPAHRDAHDAAPASALRGRRRPAHGEAPDPPAIPTPWIEARRKVVKKLSANARPGAFVAHEGRHARPAEHDRVKADLEGLARSAKMGVGWLGSIIAAEQREMRERIEDLKEPEAPDEAEAPLRARLDATDEGRLLHRYEVEADRGFLKMVGAMQARAKAEGNPQRQSCQQINSEGAPGPAAGDGPDSVPASSPNEPNRRGRRGRGKSPRKVGKGDVAAPEGRRTARLINQISANSSVGLPDRNPEAPERGSPVACAGAGFDEVRPLR